MDTSFLAGLDFVSAPPATWHAESPALHGRALLSPARDQDLLRQVAWEVGERRALEHFQPNENHVGLAMVHPCQGFAQWRILNDWIEKTRWHRGDGWDGCRMVLRVYDVSFIQFNGLNAHRIWDYQIHSIASQMFFPLPRPGTTQLAEVGFVLRTGEFLAAARSHAVSFARDNASPRYEHSALLVDPRGRVEDVGNFWDQDRILQERRRPRLRGPLRIANFALLSAVSGAGEPLGRFVSELAAGQAGQGHQVTVFVPRTDALPNARVIDGVRYEPLPVAVEGEPFDISRRFAQAAEARLHELPAFELFHCHEWMTANVPRLGGTPGILSLTSLETTRRNGHGTSPLSQRIEQAERELAHRMSCVLTPDWLRDRAQADLQIDAGRVHAFPMEARLPTEWDCPLDVGQVKKDMGFGPLDRVILYVGPLEHAAGVDLLLEAMPTMLGRAGNVRLAYVGLGGMYGHLDRRRHEMGLGWAVRLLGHQEGPFLTKVLRAAEALVLPSRYRMHQEDAVVDLARKAGRAVVTTHAGPAHLVKHEENGLVTYDNPGSMVWAMDRILGDPGHAEQMGRNGKRHVDQSVSWSDVAKRYFELCAHGFPELRAY